MFQPGHNNQVNLCRQHDLHYICKIKIDGNGTD